MIVLSELYYSLENFDKVEEICREIIAMDFQDEKTEQPYFLKEKAYFLLGDTFSQRNDTNLLIATYNEAIQVCIECKDSGSRELMERMVVESEESVDWAEAQLDLVKMVGLENYLAQQIGEAKQN